MTPKGVTSAARAGGACWRCEIWTPVVQTEYVDMAVERLLIKEI